MAALKILAGEAGVRPGERVVTDLDCEYTCAFAELTWPGNPGDSHRGLAIEGRMNAEFGALMERSNLFVCPTIALPALEAGRSYVDSGPVIDGVANSIVLDHLMTIPFNIVGRCPVMSVPAGVPCDGVPTGAAAVYQQLRPWLGPAERRAVR